eukprot:1125086-Amphidinium_carterae.1
MLLYGVKRVSSCCFCSPIAILQCSCHELEVFSDKMRKLYRIEDFHNQQNTFPGPYHGACKLEIVLPPRTPGSFGVNLRTAAGIPAR